MSLERNWTGNATVVPGSVLSFESTTLWPITTINCITVAFVFSKGKPFRKPIYTNYMFSFLLISALGLTVFILFSDFQDIYQGMEFIPTITSWRVSILVAVLIQFCVAFFVEDAILQNRKLWLLIQKKFGFYSKSQYKNWQKQLAEDPTWPPTNRTDYSGDGKNGFYINRGYETSEEIPKGKLDCKKETRTDIDFRKSSSPSGELELCGSGERRRLLPAAHSLAWAPRWASTQTPPKTASPKAHWFGAKELGSE